MTLAFGALIDQTGRSPTDPKPIFRLPITFDNSYPAGGYPGFAASLVAALALSGSSHPIAVMGFGDTSGGGASYVLDYDQVNDKLKVRVGTTGVEVAGSTDLHLVTANATVFCK